MFFFFNLSIFFASLHQVAKILELQLQSFHEYSGLISFRIDWLDLLAVQGTLKSLLQHHNLKALLWFLAAMNKAAVNLFTIFGGCVHSFVFRQIPTSDIAGSQGPRYFYCFLTSIDTLNLQEKY